MTSRTRVLIIREIRDLTEAVIGGMTAFSLKRIEKRHHERARDIVETKRPTGHSRLAFSVLGRPPKGNHEQHQTRHLINPSRDICQGKKSLYHAKTRYSYSSSTKIPRNGNQTEMAILLFGLPART
jgi:hypothetical protein